MKSFFGNRRRWGVSVCGVVLCGQAVFAGDYSDRPKAETWVTTGADCSAFAAADLDGDRFGDILTVNGQGQLCVSYSVEGWKASGWQVVAEGVPSDALFLTVNRRGAEPHAWAIRLYRPTEVQTYWPKKDDVAHVELVATESMPERVTMARISSDGSGVFAVDTNGKHWSHEVSGWKAASGLPLGADALAVATQDDVPPNDPAAKPVAVAWGDMNADGTADRITVFDCTVPYGFRDVRLTLTKRDGARDLDSDGLANVEELAAGSDPLDRDTDGDGLLDGWEVKGLPRGIKGPEGVLSPIHQDVILIVAPYTWVDISAMKQSIEGSKRLYAQLPNLNPDGTTGINLHYRIDPPMDYPNTADWPSAAAKFFPARERGLYHWLQVDGLGGGGQAMELGDQGGSGANFACFAHELGHQLGLSHTGDSSPAWCPLYPSLMNYAFTYQLGGDGNAVRFSEGRFASLELRESELREHLPFPIADLKYLEAGPYQFTLADDGHGGTLVDWNHNGQFDEGTVRADINYGGSTYGGIRREMGFIGQGPVLGRIGTSAGARAIMMATVDRTCGQVSLRSYLGAEKWTDPTPIPESALNEEPLLVGTGAGEEGLVLLRRFDGWRAAWFRCENKDGTPAIATEKPNFVPGLPNIAMSAGEINGRILLIGRRDDDSLPAWWLTRSTDEKGATTGYAVEAGPTLDFKSSVPVGFDVDPWSRRVAIVGSQTNVDSRALVMRAAWFEIQGDGTWTKVDEKWPGGEHAGWNCTTRPAVRFTKDGELNIFHTGGAESWGGMIAWRTKKIGNTKVGDGWMLNMLYDVWTLTRRPVAFEILPDGTSVYAFRWDSGPFPDGDNKLLVGHNGLGIDDEPMRDHDDSARISRWGIRHSILWMNRE